MAEQLGFKNFQDLKLALYMHPCKEVAVTLTSERNEAERYIKYFAAFKATSTDGVQLTSAREYINGMEMQTETGIALSPWAVKENAREILSFYIQLIQLNLDWTNCDPSLKIEDPEGLLKPK